MSESGWNGETDGSDRGHVAQGGEQCALFQPSTTRRGKTVKSMTKDRVQVRPFEGPCFGLTLLYRGNTNRDRPSGIEGMSLRETGFDDASELMEKAQEAINQGDVSQMLDALTASGFLDGLKRRLQKQWGKSIPASEVDECVAKAVDAACEFGSKGRSIRNLGAWLWKAAANTAQRTWRLDYSHRVDFDRATEHLAGADGEDMVQEREERRREAEARRKEAIRIARGLLPKIGSGQVVDVMELLIAAAEDGLPDLPASSVSEALGISEDASRALISRGLRRFRRVAEREGVEVPDEPPGNGYRRGSRSTRMREDIRKELTELVRAAEQMSSDVGAAVKEILREGLENPLSADEIRRLLTRVVEVVKAGARKRGDARTVETLDRDADALIRRAQEARSRVSTAGEASSQTTDIGGLERELGGSDADGARVRLRSFDGISPSSVRPTPVFHERSVAVMEGFVPTREIQLWDENERLDIHLNQFQQKFGRGPRPVRTRSDHAGHDAAARYRGPRPVRDQCTREEHRGERRPESTHHRRGRYAVGREPSRCGLLSHSRGRDGSFHGGGEAESGVVEGLAAHRTRYRQGSGGRDRVTELRARLQARLARVR